MNLDKFSKNRVKNFSIHPLESRIVFDTAAFDTLDAVTFSEENQNVEDFQEHEIQKCFSNFLRGIGQLYYHSLKIIELESRTLLIAPRTNSFMNIPITLSISIFNRFSYSDVSNLIKDFFQNTILNDVFNINAFDSTHEKNHIFQETLKDFQEYPLNDAFFLDLEKSKQKIVEYDFTPYAPITESLNSRCIENIDTLNYTQFNREKNYFPYDFIKPEKNNAKSPIDFFKLSRIFYPYIQCNSNLKLSAPTYLWSLHDENFSNLKFGKIEHKYLEDIYLLRSEYSRFIDQKTFFYLIILFDNFFM